MAPQRTSSASHLHKTPETEAFPIDSADTAPSPSHASSPKPPLHPIHHASDGSVAILEQTTSEVTRAPWKSTLNEPLNES